MSRSGSDPTRRSFAAALAIWGIALLIFVAHTVLQRSLLDVHGRVVSTTRIQTDATNPARFKQVYVLSGDGSARSTYVAYGNDAHLSRDLVVGALVAKERGRLVYSVDGTTVNDFPSLFYGATAIFAFAMLGAGVAFRLLPAPDSSKQELAIQHFFEVEEGNGKRRPGT